MKDIFKYLIIFVACLSFAAGAVSASQLVEHDFNDFDALAPEGVQFYEETTETYHYYINSQEKLAYVYIGSSLINDATINVAYGMLENIGLEKMNTDGNLTVFRINDGELSRYGEYAVEVHTEGKIVCIAGDDLNELKEIGSSVSFN